MEKRKTTLSLIPAVLACISAMLAGCTLETSGNGKLDGFWHLTAVDTIATGGKCDLSHRLLFWGVQAKFVNMSDRDNKAFDFMFRFEHSDNMLRVYEPFINDRESGDTPVNDAEMLAPFGVSAMEQIFKIETLTSKKMTLSTEHLRLYFTKM